tara:strand:+ start:1303 stop:2403 length:1101 start_codon:yes stop_codon:yes gene_type:complete
MSKTNKRIYVSVTNDLCTDQRISKVCNTLIECGYEVVLIGRVLPNSWELDVPYQIKRFKLLFNSGPLFYANYAFRLFFFLLFSKKGILLSNDLDTLLPNFLISRIRNSKLVYDSHEYFTEVPELVERPKVQRMWKRIEEFALPNVDFAYTVSQPIADAYLREYGVTFKLIRNLPYSFLADTTIEKNNVIIYQGALNIGRGLNHLISAMPNVDGELWIAGDGDVANQLKRSVVELQLTGKVFFLGRLAGDELRKITQQAKIGVSLEEEMGLNYSYALPNKLFDYIQAGVPALVSPLPEMRKIIQQYSVGELLQSRDPDLLANQINQMLTSESYSIWRSNCIDAAKVLNWEKESQKLKDLLCQVEYQS